MIKNNTTDIKLLVSHTQDAAERALKSGSPCFLNFLSETEQAYIERYSVYRRDDERLLFFGGYDDAEYKCAGFFPSYYFYGEAYDAFAEFPVCAVFAKGSGFRKLSHRDFLGSVMSLGIKREMLGDIIVSEDEASAYIFCLEKTADFLTANFVLCANDKIVCKRCGTENFAIPPKKFEVINETVSSLRIDAVLCACINVSRGDAEKMISSGLVALNHEVCEDKSKLCTEGAKISVRHHGRFVLHKIGDLNRRDRLRIVLHRLV